MDVSFIIVTHERRDALARTLAHLAALPDAVTHETWVVDNASTDGTVDMLARDWPAVRVIRRDDNEGVWARNYPVPQASGRYVVFLDDDSYPLAGALPGAGVVERSVHYLDHFPQVAAVSGRVLLPDDSEEACAMTGVFLSGAVCIRRSVLLETGGFRREFFRKAGEYDLSFRLWNLGLRVERFADLVYRHDKVMTGRSSALAHRMDVRNNLILVERYLPAGARRAYRRDWLWRYACLSKAAGQQDALRQAIAEARQWAEVERQRGRQTLTAEAFEQLFHWQRQTRLVRHWATSHSVRRVILASVSKNLYATWRACRAAGLDVQAIAEDHPAFAGRLYRGLPIVSTEQAMRRGLPAVLSNANLATLDAQAAALASMTDQPILRLARSRRMPQFSPAKPAGGLDRQAA